MCDYVNSAASAVPGWVGAGLPAVEECGNPNIDFARSLFAETTLVRLMACFDDVFFRWLPLNPLLGPIWSFRCTAWALALSLACAGCGSNSFEYEPNDLLAASLLREEGTQKPKPIAESASQVVESWFGSLGDPRWPTDKLQGMVGAENVVSMEGVQRSAGAVGRGNDKVERGLYRKHCVSCHGLSGDGRGAAAMLLSPYPRDFRRGTFKFKSTLHGSKPTRSDLVRTLHEGIPGTSMPSFAALEQSEEFQEDIEALVEYIRFLSIRGEVERKLIAKQIREGVELSPESAECVAVLQQIAGQWASAESKVLAIPTPPEWSAEEMQASIERGSQWYRSEITACAKCHGDEGRGDGASQDFDDWTKDWTILAGIDPKNPVEWKEMKPWGALKPVIDRPRNFAWSSFRGGGNRQDIFRRLVLGIEGTPMPPIARAEGNNPGLTDDQIWDLVHFVLSLGGNP